MRRTLPLVVAALVAAALVCLPVAAAAQPSLLVGAGLTSALGDFGERAESGYHARIGVEVGIPTLPVALRLDGSYHPLPSADAAFESPDVLGGALNVVFMLPGVGLRPYVFGGVGRYRVETGAVGVSEKDFLDGYQAGFGVSLGSLALGAFAELRYVRARGSTLDPQLLPLTVGFSF